MDIVTWRHFGRMGGKGEISLIISHLSYISYISSHSSLLSIHRKLYLFSLFSSLYLFYSLLCLLYSILYLPSLYGTLALFTTTFCLSQKPIFPFQDRRVWFLPLLCFIFSPLCYSFFLSLFICVLCIVVPLYPMLPLLLYVCVFPFCILLCHSLFLPTYYHLDG